MLAVGSVSAVRSAWLEVDLVGESGLLRFDTRLTRMASEKSSARTLKPRFASCSDLVAEPQPASTTEPPAFGFAESAREVIERQVVEAVVFAAAELGLPRVMDIHGLKRGFRFEAGLGIDGHNFFCLH